MPRFFTLQQAEKVLPDVGSAILEAISLKAEYEQTEAEWHNFSQRVSVMGGVRVDRAQFLELKNRREGPRAQSNKPSRRFTSSVAW